MSGIQLIVGLGNPGREYERTRHNAGFWFVDALAADRGASLRKESRFHGDAGKFLAGAQAVWLLKPGTYMNRSGRSVAALANFYRIAPTQVLVVHDELDLAPGQARLKRGGGVAGHNGLRDIQAQLGSPDFWRLRLGIGHPRTMNLQQAVADYVLHPPANDDRGAIDDRIADGVAAAADLIAGRFDAAMLKLHTRPKAAQPGG